MEKLPPVKMPGLALLLKLLDVSEDVLIAIALSALSPYQPGSLRQKLRDRQKKSGRNIELIPSTNELWALYERADFRCTLHKCRSQVSVSIDRIDTAKGYEPDNIRVLCLACNRRISRAGGKSESLNALVFGAICALLQERPDKFPEDVEIAKRAGVKGLSGSRYLVRFLRHRWKQKQVTDQANRKHDADGGPSRSQRHIKR